MSDPAPDPRRLRLNAALDGELDAANALALEQELAADPALAAEYRTLQAVRDAVRRHAPREAAPKALVDSVLALAGEARPETPANVVPLAPRARPSRVRELASARRVLRRARLRRRRRADGAEAAGRVRRGWRTGSSPTFPARRSRAQPFDVASSDRHTVKPWLAARTTVSADIVDLAAQGFPLAGGRVSVVDRVPAPTLVYRHNEHIVAVTELPLDARGARGAGERDDRRLPRRPLERRQSRLCRGLRHGRKDARANSSTRLRAAQAAPAGEGGKGVSALAPGRSCREGV